MSVLDPHADTGQTQTSADPLPAAPVAPPTESLDVLPPQQKVRGSRTGRIWVAVCAAAIIAVALIIFMIQNTRTVKVSYLGMNGSTSLSVMLLIAAVGGILLTLVVGSTRIIQLRRAVRRRNR
jgi:uncharacterized integral membrane protein